MRQRNCQLKTMRFSVLTLILAALCVSPILSKPTGIANLTTATTTSNELFTTTNASKIVDERTEDSKNVTENTPTFKHTTLGVTDLPNVTETDVLGNETQSAETNQTTQSKFVGRVVLSNTHIFGAPSWGLSQDDAERECRALPGRGLEHHLLSSTFGSHLGTRLLESVLEHIRSRIEHNLHADRWYNFGSLLSVQTPFQIQLLTRLLSQRIPETVFWTGGRLVKYHYRQLKRNNRSAHLILSWRDGSRPAPGVDVATLLGITESDMKRLVENRTYCLAWRLGRGQPQWQARHCTDRLAYACLLRHIGPNGKFDATSNVTNANSMNAHRNASDVIGFTGHTTKNASMTNTTLSNKIDKIAMNNAETTTTESTTTTSF